MVDTSLLLNIGLLITGLAMHIILSIRENPMIGFINSFLYFLRVVFAYLIVLAIYTLLYNYAHFFATFVNHYQIECLVRSVVSESKCNMVWIELYDTLLSLLNVFIALLVDMGVYKLVQYIKKMKRS